ncbi:p53 transcription factor DNA binding [Echinococcus multilocularis]|uniref:p53 transcription factor DNA binding n=1 Tax=Echinococcus multilocularis TaxID=6211 RepID=A0A087W0Q2_ECHMU|nr:p53 transcription factor DNA binding [Echinococcus multilocularis]
MSSAASSRLPVDLQARHPFRGQYDFRLDFDGKETARDCKFYADKTGRRIIFVNRDRPFVMRALFRLPLTPLNLYIRIVPLYIAHARRNEVVCRCPNHAHQLVTPELGVSATALSEMEAAETLRSFIMIQSPLARYCRLQGHLTVLLPIDRLQMALNLGPPPDHRAHRHHRERKQSEREEERLGGGVSVLTSTPPSHSQSVPSSSSSYPMGVAAENLVCRIGCYTSCLGGQTRGAVELVVRLEEMPSDPLQPPSVLGLDSVEVHCSSTPARDIRIHIENAASSSARFKSSSAVSGRGTGNRSSGVRRHGRRGLSEPSISTRTKRRLTLVGTNACMATDVGISGPDSPVNSTEVISASFSSSNASSVSSSAFIDVPMGGSGGGPKQRFYLVATKSKERAGQLRLMDDAWAAFDGVRMSSSKFMAYRKDCLLAQCIAAEGHSASTENCEPP